MSSTEWYLVKLIAAFATVASDSPETFWGALILATVVCCLFDGLRFVGHKIEKRWGQKND